MENLENTETNKPTEEETSVETEGKTEEQAAAEVQDEKEETVQEAAREEVQETAQEPAQEEVQVQAQEADQEPAQEEVQVQAQEADQEPAQEEVQVQAQEVDQETAQEPEQQEEAASEASEAPASDTEEDFPETMEELMDMYEESFKRFQEGEVVTGKVISIDKDYVLVDIGYKSEGQIRIHEFVDENGQVSTQVGDSVDVMVEWWDEEEERVVLSKEKAEKVKVWEEIKKAYDDDGTVNGTITNRVKGGFSVDIGVQAFLPGSQADLRPIRNLDEMVGKAFDFKILKYNRKRSNIVLSRRVILEAEREAKRSKTLATIHEGKKVEGVVKNITEYGVFVDLGGVDGLLHITDISWGRVKHPSELFAIGDSIDGQNSQSGS